MLKDIACSPFAPTQNPSANPWQLHNVKITHTTPDSHCHKVERAIQQMDEKTTAILASTPYIIPSNLLLYAKRASTDAMNHTTTSTLHSSTSPYQLFYKRKPTLNPNPIKSFLAFGATCHIKYTDNQRATIGTRTNTNYNNVPKSGVAINVGVSVAHPGDNLFYTPHSPILLVRNDFEIVSTIPFTWPAQPVQLQTYLTTSSPSYLDIILNDDFPQDSKTIDQTATTSDLAVPSTTPSYDTPAEQNTTSSP